MTTLCSCLSPEIVTSQCSLSKEQHTRGSSGHVHGTQFTTSSRDKTVKIWSVEKDARIKQVLALPQFGSSVTAVAWTGLDHKDKSGCIAVGMESGLIELWNIKIKETEEEAVNRLAWRPTLPKLSFSKHHYADRYQRAYFQKKKSQEAEADMAGAWNRLRRFKRVKLKLLNQLEALPLLERVVNELKFEVK
ncbi:unnamed protein product [Brassica oleracea]|uniref:Elongator complex protein 2 n=1 Tax=Brassica oleracea TaxID=3712 RepID=A0A3P6G0C8_BRAOL|nr:unnamed protein product [Brassica oleracea]